MTALSERMLKTIEAAEKAFAVPSRIYTRQATKTGDTALALSARDLSEAAEARPPIEQAITLAVTWFDVAPELFYPARPEARQPTLDLLIMYPGGERFIPATKLSSPDG